jgi:hypothetical protein
MADQYISVLLTMNQAQAGALVKFANQVALSEIERMAKDYKEFDLIKDGIDQLLKAFYEAGCSLPEPIWGQPSADMKQAQSNNLPLR